METSNLFSLKKTPTMLPDAINMASNKKSRLLNKALELKNQKIDEVLKGASPSPKRQRHQDRRAKRAGKKETKKKFK